MSESPLSFWLVLGGAVSVLVVILYAVYRVYRVLRRIRKKARARSQEAGGEG